MFRLPSPWGRLSLLLSLQPVVPRCYWYTSSENRMPTVFLVHSFGNKKHFAIRFGVSRTIQLESSPPNTATFAEAGKLAQAITC